MPNDYEDVHDIEDMDDRELRELIVQELSEYPDVDVREVDVRVEDGFVTLRGRVGTEQEMQEVSQIVTDVLGISSVSNEIQVSELERAQQSEAADEAVVEDEEVESQLGEEGKHTEPSAEHLMEDLDAELYGTHNLRKAIEGGTSYEAPDRPVQEGSWSEETH